MVMLLLSNRLIFLLILLCPLASHAGFPEPVLDSFSLSFPRAEVIVENPDGGFWVAGTHRSPKNRDGFVARFLKDGSLDLKFGNQGLALFDWGGEDFVHGLGLTSRGEIIVAGSSRSKSFEKAALIRLLPDGRPDNRFTADGRLFLDLPHSAALHYLAVDSSDRLIAVGFMTKKNASQFLIARILPNGQLDSAFASNGIHLGDSPDSEFFYSVVLKKSGKILAAGSTLPKGGDEDCLAVQFLTDGTLDASFGNKGRSVLRFGPKQDVCSSATKDPQDRGILAGYTTVSRNRIDFALARLGADGDPDSSFSETGFRFFDFEGGADVAHGVAEKNGRLILGGEYALASKKNAFGFGVIVYQPDSKTNSRFTLPLPASSKTSGTGLIPGILSGYSGEKIVLFRFESHE